MPLRRSILASAIFAASLSLIAAKPLISSYRFVTYDAPGWQNTEIYGITNERLLTGTAYTADASTFTGLVWENNKLSFVNFPGQGPLGMILYQANNHGHVTGNYWDADGIAHAIVYLIDRKIFQKLPDIPGASFNGVGGIADNGAISGVFTDDPQQLVDYVGYLFTDGIYHPFIAPKSDQALFGTSTYSMNNAETIVGYYLDSSEVAHGYFKRKNGPIVPKDVPVPGAKGTQIFAINNGNAIGGQFTDRKGEIHGFVLSNGHFTQVDYPGATLTVVFSINDAGDIAGSYSDASGNQHGFVGLVH